VVLNADDLISDLECYIFHVSFCFDSNQVQAIAAYLQ